MAPLKNHLCTLYRRTVRCLFALAAAWLFVSCLVTTSNVFYDQTTFEKCRISPDNVWLQCSVFSLICLALLFPPNKPHRSVPIEDVCPVRLRIILISSAGILAILWVLCIQAVPNADGSVVQIAASDLFHGYTYLFQPGEYMYINPHQSGLALLHLLLQHVNPNTTLPFQMFNVLCYMIVLYLLGELAKDMGLGASGTLAATCLGVTFLPLFFYVTFVYGTVPGLCFSIAGFLCANRFCRDAKWYQLLAASFFLFLALTIKPNYQVFLIALLLFASYNVLQGRRHCFLLLFALLLSWLLAKKLPVVIMEHLTGCSLDNGTPMLSLIAMGLRTDSLRGPGWWDAYPLEIYYIANMDSGLQRAMALDCISGILQGYLMDPKSMVSFFVAKNATQWSDPLFQSIWLNLSMFQTGNHAVPAWAISFLNAQGQDVFGFSMNLLQTLIYGGLVLWAWVPTSEKREPLEDLLAVTLLGGFILHTFWEAKGQYTLPFTVLSLPLSLIGYRRLALLPSDPRKAELRHSAGQKLRFLMPMLLVLLALILSVLLAPSLNASR